MSDFPPRRDQNEPESATASPGMSDSGKSNGMLSRFHQALMPTLHRVFGLGPKKKTTKELSEKAKRMTGEHLLFDEDEANEIINQIRTDMSACRDANRVRVERFRQYRKLWRNPEGMPGGGVTGLSNYHYPLVKSQIFERLAKEFQAVFGDDASVIADPVEPTDLDQVAKVGQYMKWQVFTRMFNFIYRWCEFSYNRVTYGRAHAMLTPELRYYNHPTKGRVLYSQGPEFVPCDPEDIFVPGEDAETLDDFSFFVYRTYERPEKMLAGEQEGGIWFGIDEDWDDIVRVSKGTTERQEEHADTTAEGKKATDDAEGVRKSSKGYVEVWNWYGRWRMLEDYDDDIPRVEANKPDNDEDEGGEKEEPPGGTSSPQSSLKEADNPTNMPGDRKRAKHERDVVVGYIPALRKYKRLQLLDELYPDTPHKRPFVEGAMVRDGSYWPPGIPELLIEEERELTVGENLMTQAGQFTTSPLGFYKPSSGANPDILRYEPGIMIPSDNPDTDVKFVQISFNPTFFTLNQQSKQAIVERLMGTSDFSAGRNIARPNAPKTARATIAMMEAGNVRVGLDISLLLLDIGEIFKRIWELCAMFSPDEQFFRVTGEDAEGLFDNDRGFGKMTAQEFGGTFDFSLKPATGPHAKEALKDDYLQLFSILMQLPMVQANAYAQYMLAKKLCRVFNFDISKILPSPQKPEMSMDPKVEWQLMLKGRYHEVTVSPSDDDNQHLQRHNMDLVKMHDGDKEDQDQGAMDYMIDHIREHEKQAVTKAQAQIMVNALMQQVQQSLATTGNRHGEDQSPPEQPQAPVEQQPNPGMPQGGPVAPGAASAMLGG